MNLAEDKIHQFLDGCWNAGIKNPISFLLSKRPQVYDWLKGAFPRGILPTDIDGEVEINGYFLRLEFKDEHALRNGHVPKGQRAALMRLTGTGKFTVFIIGIDNYGEPTCIEVFKSNGKPTALEEVTKEQLRERCRAWGEWADSHRAKLN